MSRGKSQGKGLEDATPNLEKILKKISQNPLTNQTPCGIINSVKGQAVSNQRSGKLMAPMGDCVKTDPPFQPIPVESSPNGIKKVEKTLDKPHRMWYNKDVPKRNEQNKGEATT